MTDNRTQLRSLVERIERPTDRVGYVLNVIEDCRGISPRTMHRAFNLASIVLGVDYDVGKACIRAAWGQDWARAESLVGRLTDSALGYVYWATSSAFPGATKIGFSRDPDKRAIALSRRYGAPVSIVRFHAGTMLEELAQHCRIRDRRIEGEWFREAA